MRYFLALFLLGTCSAETPQIRNYIVAEHKLVSFKPTPTALIGFELRSLEQAPVRIVIIRKGNELTTDLPDGRKRLWVNKKEK